MGEGSMMIKSLLTEKDLNSLQLDNFFGGKKIMGIEKTQMSSTLTRFSIRLAGESEKRTFEIHKGEVFET